MFQFVLWKSFQIFSSLKLAVILLLCLAAALAAGTIQESLHDMKVARDAVYHSGWFALLLFLLAVNVGCAALSRYPWKRRHTGFVITHAGIILILLGSLITMAFGKNGQMALGVGETSDLVLMDNQFLGVQIPGNGIDALFPINPRKNKKRVLPLAPWSPVGVKIQKVIPKAKASPLIKEEEGGSPGVEIRLSGAMGEIHEWLVLGDPMRERLKLGPAEVLLLAANSEEELEFLMNETDENVLAGTLTLVHEKKETVCPLPIAVDQVKEISGTPLSLKVLKYFKDAGVTKDGFVEKSQLPNNPALTLEVRSGDKTELHTVLARYPELPSLHGEKKKGQFDLHFFYQPFYLPASDRNALWLILGPQGRLYYRLKSQGEFSQKGPLYRSNEYRTGWMDFIFSIENYKDSIIVEREYEPVPASETKEEIPSAVQLELDRGDEKKSVWLELGEKRKITLGDATVSLNYMLDREFLPFSMKLLEFNIGRYEGTRNPMSFESLVEVNDFHKKKTFTQLINMNHPLKYGGYKFYQAGFQEEGSVPTMSVFAVGKDPGIPVKYSGSIILVLGISIMFFLKKWFDPQPKKVVEVQKARVPSGLPEPELQEEILVGSDSRE